MNVPTGGYFQIGRENDSLIIFVTLNFIVAYFLPLILSATYAYNNCTFDISLTGTLFNLYGMSLVIVTGVTVVVSLYELVMYGNSK